MTFARVLLAILFLLAGVLHFLRPRYYLRMTPAFLPAPKLVVWVSGVCEILGGAGLLLPSVRRYAAWGLIALLVAVFPANVTMALEHQKKWRRMPAWMVWARLPLQIPVIWWAWLYTR